MEMGRIQTGTCGSRCRHGRFARTRACAMHVDTDNDGKVSFTSARVRSPSSATTFTFCVTEVVKDGWIYDSDANAESCDSISVP